MEQQELEKGIGNIEPERKTLQPKKVKIVQVDIVEVGEKKNKKVTILVKHPDKEETINLSSVNLLIDKKVRTIGLWYNLDSDGNLQKGSALAEFLTFTNSKNLKDLSGKEVDTDLEGNFLCFRAY